MKPGEMCILLVVSNSEFLNRHLPHPSGDVAQLGLTLPPTRHQPQPQIHIQAKTAFTINDPNSPFNSSRAELDSANRETLLYSFHFTASYLSAARAWCGTLSI